MSASTSQQTASTARFSERGYFDLAPPSPPNDTADEDQEVSLREKAKRRYSLTMYQHIMAMRQSMNKEFVPHRSGSISSESSQSSQSSLGSYGPLSNDRLNVHGQAST